ncbi:MAG: alpha-L-rhamnosidase [Bacteroidia bacterium]|nr:alpha-L-rhamnosidase [Bacteroidia bacterium]
MKFLILIAVVLLNLELKAQVPPVFGVDLQSKIQKDELSRYYLAPQRIVWQSDNSGKKIVHPEILLNKGDGQAWFGIKKENVCSITNETGDSTGLVLDFGKEIQGGIQITTSSSNRVTRKVRIRFGESVSETMSRVIGDGTTGKEGGATNHHAMRDFVVVLPGYGTLEVGKSGFRFVRIDLVDPDCSIAIKEIRAVATLRDIPYLGSFSCNDERLNQIWLTGAYTVHLNMQDYLWDGIKRDHMVWIGDMHPEVMTINMVFGNQNIVPKSLDFVRDHTPLPAWMNGISAYSMWWVVMQYDWYYYQGNLEYLKQQKSYLLALLDLLTTKVDSSGKENLNGFGMRFLDWPSSGNKQGVHAGLQALMVMTFEKGAELCSFLNEDQKALVYRQLSAKMKGYIPDPNGCKQAASLMSLAGIISPVKANDEVISVGGAKNFSTFYGYYMLQAQAKAGAYQAAIDNIRQFWGAMLDLGATTFWEDFNLDWTINAARIDEVVPPGKKDIHRDYGAYSYIGLRHSLCHGWSSGPTTWLSQYVLGIQVAEPGCKTLRIEPHLGDLKWAKGTFPTPFGLVTVSHLKNSDGTIKSVIDAPKGVHIIQSK